MIIVTGASGRLGHHVVAELLKIVPATEIVAGVRSLKKGEDLRQIGVQTRETDYSRPDTLATAFAGVEKVLLISSSEVGRRSAQHRAVVDAAKSANVGLLGYTSMLRADTSTLKLAVEHKATEEYIRASGIPFVFLRNGWYLENHTGALATALKREAILGAAGNGRFAAASRADFAAAAATVLTTDGQKNRIYELAGDQPYTLSELAAEISARSGKQVAYRNQSAEEYAAALAGIGLPAAFADILADADAGASRGELDSTARDLSQLLGRPTLTMAMAVRASLLTLAAA